MYKNLKDFLDTLDRAGELKFISSKVSPYLEISKITDQESKSPHGGKALFFEHIEGSSFPVATNIFGSSRRICMALGVEHLDMLGGKIKKYMDINPPRSLKEALNIIPMAINFTKFFPRSSRSKIPPCQEIIYKGRDVDLSKLPVLHCWPKDAAPFITLPMVFTKSLVTGKRNVGMYRMQIFDKISTGMHWHIHKDGSHYYNEYRSKGKRMPVAVAIGADPASIYAATAPMPRGVDEMLLAGFIRNKPVTMTKCITIDMEVPSEAEFVLEGYVDPDELRLEGPFGDHTGYYSLADYYPVFHVTAITHRKNPVYNATLVGRPPMEDCYLAKATERIFLPMLQAVMPEICDYWFPWEGVFHNIVIISIDKEYSGHAQKVMSGLWGQGQMSFCKAIVVVDKNINPQNPGEVIEELVTRLDITSDITLTKGILDVLDHSSPLPNFGNKIGIDLTTRFKGELPRRDRKSLKKAPPDVDLSSLITNKVPGSAKCRHLFNHLSEKENCINRILAVSVEKTEQLGGKDFARILLALDELEMFNIFILFDKEIDLSDNSLMLWKVFNNVDPGRDMIFQDGRVVIDACKKGIMDGHEREWPDDLTFDVTVHG
ncbi:MAG: menaquinone biosynthesis decarboxylase [Desulfobacteraceae bacterium]|nr:menaquinone biosynthesis decarboxylase [Pseudomonadota bacterium]MBU4258343.1 menaquinone biosynthesis decarboxylase [Pseudomonadota bacterium]MBU4414067.1 menaquinone biosynthesis decarboxylase [Pseudomonadota bacterium]MCG2758270.1 menaquinone biosynthesis decarboxylase [Desulfobacteraceae bacterium]